MRASGGSMGTKGVARYKMKNGSQHATKPPTTTANVPAVFVSLATLLMQLCWLPRIVPNFLHMFVASASSDGRSHVTLLSAQSARCALMLLPRSLCERMNATSPRAYGPLYVTMCWTSLASSANIPVESVIRNELHRCCNNFSRYDDAMRKSELFREIAEPLKIFSPPARETKSHKVSRYRN